MWYFQRWIVHPIRLYLIIIINTGFTLVPHILYFVCYVVFSVHPIRLYLIIIIDTGFTLVPTHISYFVCYVVFSVHPIRLYLIMSVKPGELWYQLHTYISYVICVGLLFEQCALISLSSHKCWFTPMTKVDPVIAS
jgi:hypothetical protein